MTKLKNPLLSLGATGSIARAISFVRRRKQNIAESIPIPHDVQSLAQLSWRHMYLKAVALWHALSAAEQQDWESQARIRHMTGFAWFMSQALKPNPGLYLPLQGGTMSGDIDMAKYRILQLPLPVDGQEPVSLNYFNANLPPGGYIEGAHVYHNANQAIPHSTGTYLAFNSERYDTDGIHDPADNTKLTCQTAGVYAAVVLLRYAFNATNLRDVAIHRNGTWVARNTKLAMTAAARPTVVDVGVQLKLAVGDFLRVQSWQNSGAPLNVEFAAERTPEFMMQRIG